MSNTIDSKVVEMRFDNSQFEANVKTSMSTLDKLKASLHLDGATKGLENINDSVKKVNFNPIGEGIEAVKMKFSALDVMAVTTLTNITNSVVNAGKNLISSFTIEPIKSGFSEFELKMGSVQTIMASTGESLDTINDYLAELNEYSDKTIYSFADMTSNIGKFTNAGVKLEDAVMAIKGISNEAAVSGANAQEASRAMYNFSQALSAGYVKLIDWKSIENANMATVEFKQTLLDTALAMGTVTKEGDSYITTTTDLNGKVSDAFNATKNFNDSLSAQWMTTDVLTTALAAYATDVREMTEEEKKAYEEKLRGIGYTEEQIKSLEELGMKAYDSAQDVKTFSMMMDTLKEAAQSGWAETWELIIGDFEQGKKLWTSLSNFFGDIIAKISDTRNAILKSALGKGFSELSDKINSFISPAKKAIDTVGKVKDTVNEVADSVTDLGDIVDKVIIGKFGNGQERINKLTEAGINYYQVQNKVNEVLGYSKRYTEEQIAAQDKLLGIQSETTAETEKEADVNAKLTKQQKLKIVQLGVLTEAQMREAGCTEDQIEAFAELTKTANKLGMPLDEFIDKMDEIDGRWLLLDSFKSIGKSLIEVFEAIGKAWSNVFPSTLEDKADTLFDIIAGFHKFSRGILDSATANADKLRRTFEGLFAALDIVRRVAGGALSFAFKLLQSVLSAMNLNILDVTASIGDAIKGFRDWIVEHDKITECINKLGEIIAKVITKVSEWVNAFLEIPAVSNIINNFGTIVSNTFDDLETHFADCKQAIIDFIERTKKLDDITIDNIKAVFKDFYENVLKKFFNVDGKFETLETTFKEIGTSFENFITEKFGKPLEKVTGILGDFKDSVVNFVKTIGTKLRDNVGIGEILTMLLGGSLVYSMVKMGKFLESLVSPLDAIKDVLGKVGDAIKGFTLSVKAKAILTIAAAIAVLAGSIWLLAQLEYGKLWSAVGAIAVLGGALVGLAAALGAISKIQGIKISASTIGAIVAIAAALGIMVLALKGLDGLKSDTLGQNLAILAGMLVALTGVAILIGRFSKLEAGMGKGMLALIGIAVSLKIMVSALTDLDKLQLENVKDDILMLVAIMGSLALLSLALGTIGHGFSAGVAILAMAISLKLIISVLNDMADMKLSEIKKGLGLIKEILLMFGIIMAASVLAGENAAKVGIGILAMSAAIYLLLGAFKIFASMEASELEKAKKTIGDMLIVFGIVMALSKLAGQHAAKAGAMLLLMAGAMVILAGVAIILSNIDAAGLKKAVDAMSQIMIIMGLVIACTAFAKGVDTGPFIAIAVSLGILMVALGAIAMIDQSNLTAAVAAISTVMGMFAVILVASKFVGEATKSLIAMTIAIGLIGGLLIAMSILDVQNSLVNAGAISLVMLAMAATFKIIGSAGEIATKALVAIGVMTLVTAAIGAILWGMSELGVQDALPNAIALSAVLLAMAVACKIMQGIPVTGAITAAGALGAFIAILAGIMAGLLTVFGLISDTSYIEQGMKVLSMIGYAIGDFVGSIIGGLADGIMSGLPAIGQHLTDFMDNLSGFIEGAKAMDSTAMEGIKSLAEAILMLCGAELLNGITSFFNIFTGNNDLGSFAEKITSFGEAMKDYANSVKGVDWSGVKPSASAASKIIEIAKIIPNSGGLLGAIVGNNDLDDFGLTLRSFANGIKGYAGTVLGVDWSGVEPSATAANKIIEIAKIIPNSGGLLGAIVGNNDLDDFGEQLISFAEDIKGYANTVCGVDWSGIEPSATAANKIIEIAKIIPNSGGVVSWFTGNNDLDDFGEQLISFAEDIKGYANTVCGVDWSGIEPSVTAVADLNTVANNLPTKTIFDGKVTFEKFGEQLAKFANGFKEFADTISGLKLSGLTSTVKNITSLANLLNDVSGYDFSGTPNFVSALNTLGTASIDGLVTTFQNGVSRVKTAVSNICNSIQNVVNNSSTKIGTAFINIMNVSLTAITSKSNSFLVAGTKLMAMLSSGIRKGSVIVNATMGIVAAAAISAIGLYNSGFYDAGEYVVQGFASGIDENTYIAEAKSKTMAEKALDAANEALGIASPSKEFFKVGKFTVEGLANGIKKNTKLSDKAANELATGIIDEVNKTTKSMNYGTGAMKAYIKQYCKMSNSVEDNNKVIKEASSLITAYGKSLYEESEQYKTDTKQLKEHKQELADLQKQRKEIQNDTAKSSKELASELESIDEKIETAKQNIIEDENTIQKHTAETFNNLRDSIKDSLAESMDILSTSLDTGIDLLNKFSEETSNNKAFTVDPFSAFGGDSDVTKKDILDNMLSQTSGISKWKSNLEQLASRDISDELLTYLKNLGPSGAKYVDAFMQMTEAELKIASRRYKSILASEVAEQSNTILDDMQSNVDAYKEWQDNLEKLSKNKNISEGLLNYLKTLGIEGADKVKQFLQLSDEELKKASDLFAESESLKGKALMDNFINSIKEAKDWPSQLADLLAAGFDKGIVEAIGKAGLDKGKPYLDALMTMSPEDIKKINEYYEKSLKLPESSANKIIATFAQAGKDSNKAFADALNSSGDTSKTDTKTSTKTDTAAGTNVGTEVGNSVTEGATASIKTGSEEVKTSAENMSKDSAEAVKESTYTDWISAGKYCVEGFAKGIEENTFMAIAKAKAMALAALKAAQAAIDSHSPSREFMKLGSNVSEGFAIGIENSAYQVIDSVTSLGNKAVSNARNAIIAINGALNSKINTTPTITPVINMDNVNSEALNITSKIDTALTEPIKSMSKIMSDVQSNIEKSNEMVTSAISGLREDMNSYYSSDDQEIALYVDSKKLATSIAKPMNNQLNILSKRGAY